MPQPHKASPGLQLNPESIFTYPILAAHMGVVNAYWARIDFWLATLVAKAAAMSQIRVLMELAHLPLDEAKDKLIWRASRVATDMYLSLSGSAARDAALLAVLGKDNAVTFDPLFTDVKSIRKRRNRIAHGICGIDPAAPNAIIIQDLADSLAQAGGAGGKYYRYTEKDFSDLIRDTHQLLIKLDKFELAGTEQLAALIAQQSASQQGQSTTPQAHPGTSQLKPPDPQA